MVKRWEKMGRKPILQLEDSSKTSNCQPANSSSAVLRGLIQYADSDDDDEGSHVSSVGEPKKIDLEVADFLKEIDALAPNELPESSEAEAKSILGETKDVQDEVVAPVDLSGDNSSTLSSSSGPGQQCSWQQCYDERTGYTYYWNVQTNDVTWETPEEYKRLVGASAASSGAQVGMDRPPEHSNGISKCIPEDLSHHQPPKKRRKNRAKVVDGDEELRRDEEEGKIIPITFYGPSSSDDDETRGVTVAIPKKRRLLASQHRKEPIIGPVPETSEAEIGPHLPKELNGPSAEPLKIVSQTLSAVVAAECPEVITLDSSTGGNAPQENGDLLIVGTCSKFLDSVDEDGAIANVPSGEHGEAIPSSEPCCSHYVPSSMVEDVPWTDSESQQPDSISAPETLLEDQTSPDATATSDGLETDREVTNIEEDRERIQDSPSTLRETRLTSGGMSPSPFTSGGMSPSPFVGSPASSQVVEEVSTCFEETEDAEEREYLNSEPDSTTRKEGRRAAVEIGESGNKEVENEALQSLVHCTEEADSKQEAERQTTSSGQEEISSVDSPPELPAPSTEVSKRSRINLLKSEEALDVERLESIPREEELQHGQVEAPQPSPVEEDEEPIQILLEKRHSTDRPRSPEEEEKASLPDDELDLEEIERALDSALERNQNANLSAPSTSKSQAALHPERCTDEGSSTSPLVSNIGNDQLTVEDLSSLLFGKLAVLGVGKMDFSALALLHIQLETRYIDWQLGQLSSNYFMERLKEADILLKQYESKATPRGWTCNWDRENGRYFYTCNRSGRAQWDFPVAAPVEEEEEASSSQAALVPLRKAMHPSTAGQHPLVTSSTAEELFRFAAKGMRIISAVREVQPSVSVDQPSLSIEGNAEVEPRCSSPAPSPPASPPHSLPPKSPPPPPPDSTEAEGSMPPEVDMDIEDTNSKGSEDNPSSSSVETSFVAANRAPANVPFLEREQFAFYEALGNTWHPDAPSNAPPEPVVVISRAPSVSTVSTSEARHYDPGPSNCYTRSQPAVYSFAEANGCDAIGSASTSAIPSSVAHNSYNDPNFSEPGTSSSSMQDGAGSSGIVPKKEKKKPKLATGLALKKKKISSLVEKWQKIKKEQLREERRQQKLNADQKKTSDQDGKISTTM